MRIVVHDFAGHPFPLQLNRELARTGHRVDHLYCASVIGAKGMVGMQEDDPDRLSIRGLSTGRPITKASFLRRFLPDMMASADVLLALLEPQDRPYCVPSKVLSYCCAGRSVVLSADPANLASRIVSQSRCGRVVGAGDGPAFTRAVLELLADEEDRAACGANARRYAERAFDIESIAARFEAVLEAVLS